MISRHIHNVYKLKIFKKTFYIPHLFTCQNNNTKGNHHFLVISNPCLSIFFLNYQTNSSHYKFILHRLNFTEIFKASKLIFLKSSLNVFYIDALSIKSNTWHLLSKFSRVYLRLFNKDAFILPIAIFEH